MIKNFTTFVLGAGSSVPYDLPTGDGVISHIVNNYTTFAEFTGYSSDKIKLFVDRLVQSQTQSIDAFLEKNPGDREIGKEMITFAITKMEIRDRLFKRPANDNWFQHLYASLHRDAITHTDFLKNKIAFVTFNYDRVLENLLFVALQSHYNLDIKTALHVLNKIEILHVHGKIHDPSRDQSLPPEFGVVSDKHVFKRIAQGIRLQNEIIEAGQEDLFNKASKIINEKTETLVFLGFHFHQENINKLQIDWSRVNEGKMNTFASAYQWTNLEKTEVLQRTSQKIEFGGFNDANLGTLRNKVTFK